MKKIILQLASKYLKIGTCPASQKVLTYMGKYKFTRNIIFTCPAARGTRKYERTSAIFEPCCNQTLKNIHMRSTYIIFGISPRHQCLKALNLIFLFLNFAYNETETLIKMLPISITDVIVFMDTYENYQHFSDEKIISSHPSSAKLLNVFYFLPINLKRCFEK